MADNGRRTRGVARECRWVNRAEAVDCLVAAPATWKVRFPSTPRTCRFALSAQPNFLPSVTGFRPGSPHAAKSHQWPADTAAARLAEENRAFPYYEGCYNSKRTKH